MVLISSGEMIVWRGERLRENVYVGGGDGGSVGLERESWVVEG